MRVSGAAQSAVATTTQLHVEVCGMPSGPDLHMIDVIAAGEAGDGYAVALIESAGRTLGDSLAALVSTLNPSLIVIGGPGAMMGETYLDRVRESVHRRGDALRGAAALAAEQLFEQHLADWVDVGDPVSTLLARHRTAGTPRLMNGVAR